MTKSVKKSDQKCEKKCISVKSVTSLFCRKMDRTSDQ